MQCKAAHIKGGPLTLSKRQKNIPKLFLKETETMANAGLLPDEEGEKTMGATGLLPGFPRLPLDPIRAWLNRYLSFADMMRLVEWQEICNPVA